MAYSDLPVTIQQPELTITAYELNNSKLGRVAVPAEIVEAFGDHAVRLNKLGVREVRYAVDTPSGYSEAYVSTHTASGEQRKKLGAVLKSVMAELAVSGFSFHTTEGRTNSRGPYVGIAADAPVPV